MRFWTAMLLVTACGSKGPSPTEPRATAQPPSADAARAEQVKAKHDFSVKCPPRYSELAEQLRVMCLDPKKLGDEMVNACVRDLRISGFEHDLAAETEIVSQTGKKLTCYHKESPPP